MNKAILLNKAIIIHALNLTLEVCTGNESPGEDKDWKWIAFLAYRHHPHFLQMLRENLIEYDGANDVIDFVNRRFGPSVSEFVYGLNNISTTGQSSSIQSNDPLIAQLIGTGYSTVWAAISKHLDLGKTLRVAIVIDMLNPPSNNNDPPPPPLPQPQPEELKGLMCCVHTSSSDNSIPIESHIVAEGETLDAINNLLCLINGEKCCMLDEDDHITIVNERGELYRPAQTDPASLSTIARAFVEDERTFGNVVLGGCLYSKTPKLRYIHDDEEEEQEELCGECKTCLCAYFYPFKRD